VQFTPSLLYWPPTWYSSYSAFCIGCQSVQFTPACCTGPPLGTVHTQPSVLVASQYSSHQPAVLAPHLVQFILSLLYWLPVSTVHSSLLYWLPLSAIYIQPAVLSTTQYSSQTACHAGHYSVQFNIQPAVLSTTQYSSHPNCCSFHRLARFTPSVLYCSSLSSVHTQPAVLATARNSSHSACCTGHHAKQLHPASCTGHCSTAQYSSHPAFCIGHHSKQFTPRLLYWPSLNRSIQFPPSMLYWSPLNTIHAQPGVLATTQAEFTVSLLYSPPLRTVHTWPDVLFTHRISRNVY
jgi:hypothetical protein